MDIDIPSVNQVINKLGLGTNGRTQLMVTQTARDFMRPYVPRLNQVLRNSAELVDNNTAVLYRTPYAHYQYIGIVYVDPITGSGAFYNEDDGFWSRPNVRKVPSNRDLKYTNPRASARWDRKMIAERGEEFERNLQNWFDKEYK